MNSDIKVSVICNTYNHEDYIRDALESFIMQKTNFKFEVLVHDDASTDKTPEIIREYEEKYPDIIKPIYQTENQFRQRINFNLLFQFPRAKGKYFAFCEGDDYWIDENKLQKQFDYMESHQNCSMCCHNSIRHDKSNNKRYVENPVSKTGYASPFEIICEPNGTWVSTASFFVRREFIENRPDVYSLSPVGDFATRLRCLEKGDIFYDSTPMSIYNYKNPGSWSSGAWKKARTEKRTTINFLEKFDEYTNYKYTDEVKHCIKYKKMNLYIESGNIKMLQSNEFRNEFKELPLKKRTKAYLARYAPFLLKIKRIFLK